MKKILISLSTIALVAAAGFGATRAYFTSTASSTGNTFTAGTLAIELDPNGIVNDDVTPRTLPISLANLYPGYNGVTNGDYWYPAVANKGTMDFYWKFNLAETASTSPQGGDLGNVLKVKIEQSLENGAPWDYPAGGTFNCQNPVIWNNSYPGAAVSTVYTGNVSAYSSAVSMGKLAAGKGICYRLSFSLDDTLTPGGTNDNSYQGASAVYTLGVNATQNP